MANRHLARSLVLQTLFEWDFNEKKSGNVISLLERNIEEFSPDTQKDSFMENLLNLVLKKQATIDQIIEKAAPDWPIDRISVVDRNVLRIGLTELLFGKREEVPPKVAINEAIELAKKFGGEKSGKFVNGVMGAVYREMGEPGKDDRGKKKEEEDITKIPVEQKAGGVIFSETNGEIKFAMVHDVFGYWTLAKGSIEAGESPEEGALREIKEETGLDAEIVKFLSENEYMAFHPEKGKIRKQVRYYLTKAEYGPIKLGSTGGLDGAEWFSIKELDDIKTYDDILPLLAQSVQHVTNNK